MKKMISKAGLAIFTGCLLLGVSSCVCIIGCGWEGGNIKYERTVEVSTPMAGIEAFWARTENGSITLKGEDTTECRITAIIQGRSFTAEQAETLAIQTEVVLVPEGNRLKADLQKPQIQRGESISVSYDIILPVDTAVELHSTNGAIRAENLTQSAAAYSTNGSLYLTAVKGDVTGHSTNGKVQLQEVSAKRMDLRSTNGSLSGHQVAGDLNASTTNGSINMEYSLSAETIIQIDMSTTNGNISLTVPRKFSAQVDASTTNGRIHTDLPVTVQGKIDKSIHGTIGAGEGRLKLRTTNGNIKLYGN